MKKFLFVSMVALSVIAGGCKKKDKCKDTVCLNGGICIDGTCSCPTGYTGSDCGEQVLPSKITIDTIKVTNFPAMNGGNNWDGIAEPKPDIYVTLRQVGGSSDLVNTQNDRISNADAQPHVLMVTPVHITDLGKKYSISLKDYDALSTDELMGTFDFDLYTSSNKFPKKLKIANTGATLEFELSLTYTY